MRYEGVDTPWSPVGASWALRLRAQARPPAPRTRSPLNTKLVFHRIFTKHHSVNIFTILRGMPILYDSS